MIELNIVFEVAARTCLGVVFLTAAGSKVRRRSDWEAFRTSVGTLLPVPARGVTAAASAVITLEMLIPLLLSTPRSTPVGFGAAICLLAAFTAAVIAARRRGVRTPCRCFGASAVPPGPRHAVRNVLLLMLAGFGLAAHTAPHDSGPVLTIVIGVLVGLGSAALFVVSDDVLDLFVDQPASATVPD